MTKSPSLAFVSPETSLKFGWFLAISLILLSVSLSSIFTVYSSNLIFSKDLISTFGSSVTDKTYSKSLSSPYVFKSSFGWPAGLIFFSSNALVDVSFKTLSKTSPKTALPNCLLKFLLELYLV